jgi:hypothetical protein
LALQHQTTRPNQIYHLLQRQKSNTQFPFHVVAKYFH